MAAKRAREVEADESPDAMDRAFERVVGPSSLHGDAAETVKPLRTTLADVEHELAVLLGLEQPDPVAIRRLRVKVRNLKRLVVD